MKNLQDAITKRFEEQDAVLLAAEEDGRVRARADLALFGTPAWDLLPQTRRDAAAREQLAQHDETVEADQKAREEARAADKARKKARTAEAGQDAEEGQ